MQGHIEMWIWGIHCFKIVVSVISLFLASCVGFFLMANTQHRKFFYFHLTQQESNPGCSVERCLLSATVRSRLFFSCLITQLLINAVQPLLRHLLSINHVRFIFAWVFRFFGLYGSLDLFPLWNSLFLIWRTYILHPWKWSAMELPGNYGQKNFVCNRCPVDKTNHLLTFLVRMNVC